MHPLFLLEDQDGLPNLMNTPDIISTQINHATLELLLGDITEQDTAAIVNAANSSLLGGGGVDGAIHRAAGPQLLEETRTLGGCQTGYAKISGGYNLKAKHVIHAVGPIYRRNDPTVAELLASAYRHSLDLAAEYSLTSIAFPAISTGIYGYPLHEAAPIALKTVIDFLETPQSIELVRFVLYNESAFEAFSEALDNLLNTEKPSA